MYVCLYRCVYICICVCIYIYIYIYVYVIDPSASAKAINTADNIVYCPLRIMQNTTMFGWHYLSDATCPTRPHLFSTALRV